MAFESVSIMLERRVCLFNASISLHKVCEKCRFHFYVFKSYPRTHTFHFQRIKHKEIKKETKYWIGKKEKKKKVKEDGMDVAEKREKDTILLSVLLQKNTSWSENI